MSKIILYIIVFICGGSVLAIEILGTRIIGPFYGVSLFLWSALISVTLIALSAGYMTGGRLADKLKSYNILAVIVLAAGLLIFLIPFIRNTVVSLTANLGLRSGVLAASFILFFFPLALLGMVTPYAIKLRIHSLENVGKNSGDLYAISTIGSVFAALLTGFILIPSLGVIKLTLSIGFILILTSFLIFISGKKYSIKMTALITGLLMLYLFFSLPFKQEADAANGIVEAKQSTYGEIRVMDKEEERYLLIDGGIHTAIDKNTGENLMPYVMVLDLMKYFMSYSGDMLLIGIGGGSVLRSFYKDNWDVESVEIDPLVTEIAHKYFFLDSASTVIYHMDGREFLKTNRRVYNLIIVDAFGSSSVPFHLTTVESFKLLKERLTNKGIAAINIEAVGWDDIIVKSLGATLNQVFRHVIIFPIAEPPDKIGNLIIAGSDEPFELRKELERDYSNPEYRFSPEYERAHAWDNRFLPDPEETFILTDDLNPVDIWSERINLVARKELHSFLGEESFLW